MALALYRKYRPAKFAEVVGQEHVTDPLGTALAAGRINHAYLFSGPRGCGKTSSARILARSLNCVEGPTPDPCGVCSSCVALAPEGPGNIDVVELDAASHGGVDDARELRDRAFYAPAESRYRVFIVDEAHMVTTQGFNALLKIVEEPPEHLVFVFATTEPDKVLPTIRSRTHHYPFRLIPPGTLRSLLERICADEGVRVEPAVYPLVIRAGGGSARDTLSVLDQLLAGAGPEGVTYERAVALLGVTDVALIDDVVDALGAGDGAAVYQAVDRLVEAGHDPRRFAADLLQRLRDLMLLQAVPEAAEQGLVEAADDELSRMIEQAARLGPATLARYGEIVHAGLTEMRGATAPRLLLELLCARMLLPAATTSDAGLLERLERVERRQAIAPEPGGAASAGGSTAAAPVASAGAGPVEAGPVESGGVGAGGIGSGGAGAAGAGATEVAPRFVRPSRRTKGAADPAAQAAGVAPPSDPSASGETRRTEEGAGGDLPVRGEAPDRTGAGEASDREGAGRGEDEAAGRAAAVRGAGPGGSEAEGAGRGSAPGRATGGREVGAPVESAGGAPTESVGRGAVESAGRGPAGSGGRDPAESTVRGPSGPEEPRDETPGREQVPARSEARPQPETPSRPAPAAEPRPDPAGASAPAGNGLDASAVRRVWSEILAAARQRSRSTEALLVNATVRAVQEDTLILGIASPPLARRLSDQRNTEVIVAALHAVLGVQWRVRCETGDGGGPVQPPPRQTAQRPAPRRPSRREVTPEPESRPERARQERPEPRRPAPPQRPRGDGSDDGIPLPPEPPSEEPPPDDEEAMFAEADASRAERSVRRDPEEVAIELLSSQLGARAFDQR
ncbi:DNA polymerase III subunit gamma and tau [Pseudonocardia sp. RS010]|uniref:DNA polymerase III subunit gamma and tau n=1 Tax=Pseudonocardia sp. RS010 TaxID=3385979 RepID=UPI00399FB5ED